METILKQRLVGAVALIGLAVIFLPMLLSGSENVAGNITPPKMPIAPAKPTMQTIITLQPEQLPEEQHHYQPSPANANNAEESPAQMLQKVEPEPPLPTVNEELSEKVIANKVMAQSQTAAPPIKHKPLVATSIKTSLIKTKAAKLKVLSSSHTPNPQKAIAAASAWAVQLGSFSDMANAQLLQKQLKSKGYTAFIRKGKIGKTTIARVFVGPMVKHQQAVITQGQLEQSMHVKGSVVAFAPASKQI